MNKKAVSDPLAFDLFDEPGLYLLFPDGRRVDLTRPHIEAATERFLNDPSLIPDSVKAATEYVPCAICPERHRARICHAIMPTLPFIESMNRFNSYDEVTAVYREEEDTTCHVSRTTVQQALQYMAILSLVHYCEVGRAYNHFFKDINPLMPSDRIAAQIHQNIFWECRGDAKRVEEVIAEMRNAVAITTKCQVNRLRLIVQSDALINAFYNTMLSVEWLIFAVEQFGKKE